MFRQTGLLLAGVICTGITVQATSPVVFKGGFTPPLSTTNVSPDSMFGATNFGSLTPNGRIKGVVITPLNDSVLYATGELTGVWKSSDSGQSWVHASHGLRTGVTIDNESLAVDDNNTQRLLYAADNDDGRPQTTCPDKSFGCTLGGLWASLDAAGSWQHVDLPSCPQPSISSITFGAGKPFVSTRCGIATSSDPALASGSWTFLPAPPFTGNARLASSGQTLFACAGFNVYRSQNPATMGSWTSVALPGTCQSVAIAPLAFEFAASTAVVFRDVLIDHALFSREVSIVSFNDGSVVDLGFSNVARTDGSGTLPVYTVRRKSAGQFDTTPGSAYDIYVGDGLDFFVYDPHSTPSWDVLEGLHVDTWGMAFPSTYDPSAGDCSAYASNDGGVYFNTSNSSNSFGCSQAHAWVLASAGLQVALSGSVTGLSQPQSACPSPSQPCPALYVPTGDDDVWATAQGGIPGTSWQYLGSSLGDASRVYIDPANTSQVVSARGGGGCKIQRQAALGPGLPVPGNVAGPNCIEPQSFMWGFVPPEEGGLSQVLSLPSESSVLPIFVAVQSPRVGGPATDDTLLEAFVISSAPTWIDLAPGHHFGPQQIAITETSGGVSNPIYYVMTANDVKYDPSSLIQAGQIYRANTTAGAITSWNLISKGIVRAFDFFVDPYDPRYLYATDLGDGTIKSSSDGGNTWNVERTLMDIATNYGEYRFDCGQFAGGNFARFFNPGCPIAWVEFNRDHPEIRVAILYPGGVAFSRDYGNHWMPLDSTNADPSFGELLQLPVGAFYDAQPNPTTGAPSIYVALEGNGDKRIDGPFPTLVSANMVFCVACSLVSVPPGGIVQAWVDTVGLMIPLRAGADGLFRGELLFDSAKYTTLNYYFTVNGNKTQTFTKTISAGEIASGSAAVNNAGLPVVTGKIVGKGKPSPGVMYVDLQLTDTGTGLANGIAIKDLVFRTLAGTGKVTYNATLSGALPISTSALGVGGSVTFRLYLNVPSTVSRFSIMESGTVQDGIFTTYSFSIGEAVIP
jgi:hypothetical protein